MRNILRPLFLFLILSLLSSAKAHAMQETSFSLLRDEAGGYILPLPQGWQEVTNASALQELVSRLCPFFISGEGISGASHVRGAVYPDDAMARPAMVLFALDYRILGLGQADVRDIAKDSPAAIASLANAIQTVYSESYPQSIKINSHQGDDFFSLNLRSVLDFDDEAGTTRNQHVKVVLAANGALAMVTLYEGPADNAYDSAIAASVRAMRALPENALQHVNPPFQPSFFDYVLVFVAIIFVAIIVRRLRSAMRG